MTAYPAADGTAVAVVGAGYVGLVTAVGLAETGSTVRVVEADPHRLSLLQAGTSPIYEPGLDEALTATTGAGRLVVTGDVRAAVAGAGVVIVAVGTPPTPDGEADLSQVHAALREVSAHAADGTVVVIKSTVPPGTTAKLSPLQRPDGAGSPLAVVACPEFLREGSALKDIREPSRVVVGGADRDACERVAALFRPRTDAILVTDATSAELVKYGANAFLATKISFINEMARICDLVGGDIDVVADGIGRDPRIGSAFLRAGLGFGGSCFPKDLRALDDTASYHGHSFWMLKAALEVNRVQRARFVSLIQDRLSGIAGGGRVAVLGLAFKPGTDDLRQAASIDVIRALQRGGATVSACDPVAVEAARAHLPGTSLHADPYECVAGADVVALVTEWPEYVRLDWSRVAGLTHGRSVVDGRNCLDVAAVRAAGFSYRGIGRSVSV